jgi:hypothetical protein
MIPANTVIILAADNRTLIGKLLLDTPDHYLVDAPLQMVWDDKIDKVTFVVPVWARVSVDRVFNIPKAISIVMNPKQELIDKYNELINPKPEDKTSEEKVIEPKKD